MGSPTACGQQPHKSVGRRPLLEILHEATGQLSAAAVFPRPSGRTAPDGSRGPREIRAPDPRPDRRGKMADSRGFRPARPTLGRRPGCRQRLLARRQPDWNPAAAPHDGDCRTPNPKRRLPPRWRRSMPWQAPASSYRRGARRRPEASSAARGQSPAPWAAGRRYPRPARPSTPRA